MIVSLVIIKFLLILIELIFIFRIVWLVSCKLHASWVFISLKKWIIFGAVCRNFSFINKKILIEILVLVFVRYSFFLRLILCLINWFCYWIANIYFCEKIIVMISKVIATCVFLFFGTLIIS